MKITLTCKIPLKTATVYLKLRRYTERKDIQDYLNGKQIDNPRVANGIRNYLAKIQLFDQQGHLTREGNKAKETGMVACFEEGKYKIWFTGNDSLLEEPLQNKIYYLFRETPKKETNTVTVLDPYFDDNNKEHLCLPTSHEKDWYTFKVIKPENGFAGIVNPGVTNINFERNLEKSGAVDIYSGNFNQNTHILNTPIPANDEDLDGLIKMLLPNDWDDTNNRCKIPFKVFREKSEEGLETFERNHGPFKYEGYTVNIEKLPLEPINLDEAKLWRNCLLKRELARDYLHPNDFNSKVVSVNQRGGFKAYYDNLNEPGPDEFIGIITPSKKSETGAAFWHISAPVDLNPAIPAGVYSSSFDLSQGETLSFNAIAAKIKTIDPIKVFYYDQYIINRWQQKASIAFLKSFSCTSLYLITNVSGQTADIIAKDQSINQIDIKTIFSSQKPQHDRYLILALPKELEIWNISNSIDYIRFNNFNISSGTDGILQQSVIFHKASNKTILHKPLLNYIEQEVKNV
ncbi:hypothetical protein FACS189461_0660 [Spirochaetia bacterium]|nr:hypothetical protein FACS189461_0660 [Spirochaetia bacterium]